MSKIVFISLFFRLVSSYYGVYVATLASLIVIMYYQDLIAKLTPNTIRMGAMD